MTPILIEQLADHCTGLFAARPTRRVGVSPSYYYVGLGVLAVLMLVAGIKAYRMWEELHDVAEPDSPADLLEAFEEAHAAGELDDQEFERVRQRLAGPAAVAVRPRRHCLPTTTAPSRDDAAATRVGQYHARRCNIASITRAQRFSCFHALDFREA